jgi:hypothetical protein
MGQRRLRTPARLRPSKENAYGRRENTYEIEYGCISE